MHYNKGSKKLGNEHSVKIMTRKSWFNRFAKWSARAAGNPLAFSLAVAVIVSWAALGPLFGFSDSWQLAINTSTTIVTFLMVFLIQNTQNRDSAAAQIKLDELIRAVEGAHNALLDLEELEDRDLEKIRGEYEALAERARKSLAKALDTVGSPDVDDSQAEAKHREKTRPRK